MHLREISSVLQLLLVGLWLYFIHKRNQRFKREAEEYQHRKE